MASAKSFFELVVLGFKLSKLGSVRRLHAAKAEMPFVEAWLAKGTGPAKFLEVHARISLFEEANDLLFGKSGLFHSRYSSKLADFVPSLWFGREGAGQLNQNQICQARSAVVLLIKFKVRSLRV
jgi:hypothetical protein